MAFGNLHQLGGDVFLWDKYLELTYPDCRLGDNQDMSIALMGIALTMVAVDPLAHELKASALPSYRT